MSGHKLLLSISIVGLASAGAIAVAQEQADYFRLKMSTPMLSIGEADTGTEPPTGGVNDAESNIAFLYNGTLVAVDDPVHVEQVRVGHPVYIEIGATGGFAPYALEASGFPLGVDFDPGTDLATGTAPSVAQVYPIDVSVADASGATATDVFDFAVIPELSVSAEPIETVVPDANGEISFTPDSTGLIDPVFSFGDGFSPPGWLEIDPATGRIHGTPPEGVYEVPGIIVTVTDDQSSPVDSEAFTLQFGAAPPAEVFAGVYGVSGSQIARAVTVSADGGFYLVGDSGGADSNGDVIVRLSASAQHEWTRRTLGGSYSLTRDVATDATGVYAVGAITGSVGTYDSYMVKYSHSGDELFRIKWDIASTSNQAYHVAVSDGVYVASGPYLTKFDSNGAVLWNKQVSAGQIKALKASGSGVVALFDYTSGSGQIGTAVAEINPSGAVVSYRTLLLSANNLSADFVDIASDGALLISGYESSGSGANSIGIRLTSTGSVAFAKRYNAYWNRGLMNLPGGDLMIVDQAGKYARLNANGEVLWGGSIDSIVNTSSMSFRDMTVDGDKLYLGGNVGRSGTSNDFMGIVLSTSGVPDDENVVVSDYALSSSDVSVAVSSPTGVSTTDVAHTAVAVTGKSHETAPFTGDYYSSVD